jgi:hypothetical protein
MIKWTLLSFIPQALGNTRRWILSIWLEDNKRGAYVEAVKHAMGVL